VTDGSNVASIQQTLNPLPENEAQNRALHCAKPTSACQSFCSDYFSLCLKRRNASVFSGTPIAQCSDGMAVQYSAKRKAYELNPEGRL